MLHDSSDNLWKECWVLLREQVQSNAQTLCQDVQFPRGQLFVSLALYRVTKLVCCKHLPDEPLASLLPGRVEFCKQLLVGLHQLRRRQVHSLPHLLVLATQPTLKQVYSAVVHVRLVEESVKACAVHVEERILELVGAAVEEY